MVVIRKIEEVKEAYSWQKRTHIGVMEFYADCVTVILVLYSVLVWVIIHLIDCCTNFKEDIFNITPRSWRFSDCHLLPIKDLELCWPNSYIIMLYLDQAYKVTYATVLQIYAIV